MQPSVCRHRVITEIRGGRRRGGARTRIFTCLLILVLPLDLRPADGQVDPPPASGQDRPPRVLVPVSEKPIVVDGVFSEGEWQDAEMVGGEGRLSVYLVRNQEDVFLGVRGPVLELPVMDLFLCTGGPETYHLHVSSYLADGIVPETGPTEPYLETELTLDWWANRVAWDSSARDSLAAIGVFGREMLERSILPMDGFEVRIDRSQFENTEWLLRLRIEPFASHGSSFPFPPDGPDESAGEWLWVSVGG